MTHKSQNLGQCSDFAKCRPNSPNFDWLRIGYGLVTDWLRIGYGLSTEWLQIGYGLITEWLRIGYRLAKVWLRIGFELFTDVLRMDLRAQIDYEPVSDGLSRPDRSYTGSASISDRDSVPDRLRIRGGVQYLGLF